MCNPAENDPLTVLSSSRFVAPQGVPLQYSILRRESSLQQLADRDSLSGEVSLRNSLCSGERPRRGKRSSRIVAHAEPPPKLFPLGERIGFSNHEIESQSYKISSHRNVVEADMDSASLLWRENRASDWGTNSVEFGATSRSI